MKNKHLVLLFLITLLIGLAVRKAPWKNATFFQTQLLRIDSMAVQQIQMTLPGQMPLLLQRGDIGWSGEQGDRSVIVPEAEIRTILACLTDIRSIRIVKTMRPDSLGFTPAHAITLSVTQEHQAPESLVIGWEVIENGEAATFIQLPQHEGIYLVNNHLRKIFSRSLSDFRNQTIARFAPSAVDRFCILRQNQDTLRYQKEDSIRLWFNLSTQQFLPDEKVQAWFRSINGLEHLPYADLFDESHVQDETYAEISLQLMGQADPITLTVYRIQQVNVPEVMPSVKPDRKQLGHFVLKSSMNPTNYFAFPDTNLLHQICQPF